MSLPIKRVLWLKFLQAAAVFSALIVLLIIGFLINESWSALREISWWHFFTQQTWHPASEDGHATYGLMPMLLGTLYASLGAVFIAGPMGVLLAIFMRFYAPTRLARYYREMIELLAGIPSVVYGLWGLTVMVPWIARFEPPGASLITGVLILSLMILPTVALLAEAAFVNVPVDYFRAAAALGMSRTTIIRRLVLPVACPGLITAVILQMGRALGETMAVLMVCGNVVQYPHSLFDPIRTLTANIALEMGFATDLHRSALFVSGLLLMMLVTTLVWVTHYLTKGAANG